MAREMVTARPARAAGVVDWLMLALALVSVGLLGYLLLADVPPATARWIFVADCLICAVFAAEFLWCWWAAGWDGRFPLRNWYEILGMIPVSHPALRGFRLLRIVVLAMRLARAADRAYSANARTRERFFGEQFSIRLVRRFSGAIIEVIKRPVTVAVLDEVVDVLQTGHYSRNVARALQENRLELRAMILEKIKEDAQAGRLSVLPFHDDIVRAVADAVFRVLHEVLNDPRTDELVADVLRENVEQIRMAVRGGHEPLAPTDWPLPPGLQPPDLQSPDLQPPGPRPLGPRQPSLGPSPGSRP